MNIDRTWLPDHPVCDHRNGVQWEIDENVRTKRVKIKVSCKQCPTKSSHDKPLSPERLVVILAEMEARQ